MEVDSLFQLLSLRQILIKQCRYDLKKHNPYITNFGKVKSNLCNYMEIIQPETRKRLQIETGKHILNTASKNMVSAKVSNHIKAISKNQYYSIHDKYDQIPLTHKNLLILNTKAIKNFKFVNDTSINEKENSWVLF